MSGAPRELHRPRVEPQRKRMYTRRSSGRLEHVHVDAASPLVAVAIDKDKGSQNALKWAADNLVAGGHTLTLIHVNVRSHSSYLHHEDSIRSPFPKVQRGSSTRSYADTSFTDTDRSFVSSDTDMSFVSSGRPSNERSLPLRLSSGSEGIDNNSFETVRALHKSVDPYFAGNEGSTGTSWSSQTTVRTPLIDLQEDVEEEMKRLRLELKQTMDMYNNACKEALTAKQKAMELQRWKIEEEKRLYEAHMAEDAAMALVERERAKCRAAIEAAQAEHRVAELEAQKRIDAGMEAIKEAAMMKKALDSLAHADVRYRKYAIEEIEAATEFFADHRKIGEGGYGPVYKCYLDHTAVAIKVLRPDAAQGRSQFHQEYMANGSLEDRLLRRGNTPAIPWQYRFQIAAEIATCLLFLHHMKPEPLVHRDLKPGNILLDKYYVSKISDVGLARLVPPSVADSVTRCRMTAAAGTFCYIDPEYQQTGMLGVKSDIYSLGILLLQIITAKPPAGLTLRVSHSIEEGTFDEMLDAEVADWPVEEAQCLAEIALKCTELRRKDRPDLERVVLPELERLRSLAEDNLLYSTMPTSTR
ncbi:hypothetical protein BHE74_00035142 [Ensete ventricosum]|nr:hypothetical protein BHE74_00035142 [Ensete ventricosum]